MDRKQKRQTLFVLFNEINIIASLSATKLTRLLPDNLHISHFGVINHLIRHDEPRTPLRIAKAFQVTKATMTNTLARLSKRGLIEIRDNPADRRSKLVFITKLGRKFRDQAVERLYPYLDDIDTHLDIDALAELLPQLQLLRQYLDQTRSE